MNEKKLKKGCEEREIGIDIIDGIPSYCSNPLIQNSIRLMQFKDPKIRCKIDLKSYAKIVIENYREEIKRDYEALGINPKQLRLGGDFCFKRSDFENPDKFDEIVNSRDKYLWYGLVYEITEILSDKTEGKNIGGFTTDSMRNRWKNYVFKAVFQQGKGGKLHKSIYNYLYEYGFENLKINGKYNWRLIFGLLNSRYRRTPTEVHSSSNSLRRGEIEFIATNDLIESGLNIRLGGEGGRDKIDLPMIKIAYYIALGYMETEIHKILNDRGYFCSVNTVRRRIREFWGSFEEAQIKFLRPVFYQLLKDGFKLHEINDAFDRFTINYIETMFGSIPYKELIKIKNSPTENLLDLHIIEKLDGWEGRTKLQIPANILIELIVNYSTMNEAIKDQSIQIFLQEYEISYYRFGFIRQIYNQLGYETWDEARKRYAVPLIINDFRNDQPFDKTYEKYGWSRSYAHNHNRISSILFFEMRSIQVRQFLIENPTIDSYHEFEEKLLIVKEKLLKQLPLTILNNLIVRHVQIDRAQLELNSMGYSAYNFLNEVEKHYFSWNNACDTVKIPLIINAFRRGDNPIETYEKVGYSRISASHHNSISNRLFFGANTEIVLLFLGMNPDILTLKDFEIVYKKGLLEKIDEDCYI